MKRLLVFNLATDIDDPILGFTSAWLRALAEHCQAIDVITMRAGRLALPEQVQIYSVGQEKGYSEPRRALEFYRILGRLLTTRDYDGCFVHMMPIFAIMAAPLLKAYRIPSILWYTHKSVTWRLRLAEKLVERVVTASPESFRLPSRKVKVIGHGIDTTLFVPAAQQNEKLPSPIIGGEGKQSFTILTVGRVAPIKQIDLLIEAIYDFVQQNPALDLQVRIVGGVYEHDVAYAEGLKQQVMAYDLGTIIKFVGPVRHSETVSEYQHATLMVNLSQTGSVDKAVLEAMSCGIPIITSNPAFNSVLSEKLAVEWVIGQDTVRQLVEKLKLVMYLPNQTRQELGQELRRLVISDHDLRALASKLMEEFKTIRVRVQPS